MVDLFQRRKASPSEAPALKLQLMTLMPIPQDTSMMKAVRIYVIAALMALSASQAAGHYLDIHYAVSRLILHSSGDHVSAYDNAIVP